ncbi:MAG: ABC transporter permease [Dysgonomonas sp.]
MYKTYLKQAIEMLKQNKFISIITIIGTALAIMMIMVIIVTDSIKTTNIPPEINRDRTLYILREWTKRKDGKGNSQNGTISYKVYKTYISEMKVPELHSAIAMEWEKSVITSPENEMERVPMDLKPIDASYWKIMSFSFISGKPFSQEDFDSGLKKAVITENTSKTLFGTQDALGKTININFIPYTVVGIIKDVSPIFHYAYSNVYIPYTSREAYESNWFRIMVLAKDKQDFNLIDDEIRAMERKFNSVDTEWDLELKGPYNHSAQEISRYSSDEPDMKSQLRKTIFILCVLLLVPAINLSSFSLSRIKRRTEEIGVRKAFGAKKYIILIQVLYENFVTSLIGGVIGLTLSYIVVIWLKQWLLGIESDSMIPLETFISLPIFIAVFIICILLNLLSAGIPAYKASKVKIIDSLNQNNEKS